MINQIFTALFIVLMMSSCHNATQTKQFAHKHLAYPKGTFGYDLSFLQQQDSVIVLTSNGGKAQIIVSPKYQAKVFTSTADGNDGFSFGWVNYKAFSAPKNEHMNAYSGENRFWLGSEGGRFSLYFQPGAKMEFANWKTPAAFDTESWQVTDKKEDAVTMHKDMRLTHYKGTSLQISVDRTIKMVSSNNIETCARSSTKKQKHLLRATLLPAGRFLSLRLGGSSLPKM